MAQNNLNSTWPPANYGSGYNPNPLGATGSSGSFHNYSPPQIQGQQMGMSGYNPGYNTGSSPSGSTSNLAYFDPAIYGASRTQPGEVADFTSTADIGPPVASSTLERQKKRKKRGPTPATVVGYTQGPDVMGMSQYPKFMRRPIAKLVEWWNDSGGPVHRVMVFLGERAPDPTWRDFGPQPQGGHGPIITDSFYNSSGVGKDPSQYATANDSSMFSAQGNVTGGSNVPSGGASYLAPGYGSQQGNVTGSSYASSSASENQGPRRSSFPCETNPYMYDSSWWWSDRAVL